jgi:hypothetical protein
LYLKSVWEMTFFIKLCIIMFREQFHSLRQLQMGQ